jgi:hypothetical protein
MIPNEILLQYYFPILLGFYFIFFITQIFKKFDASQQS